MSFLPAFAIQLTTTILPTLLLYYGFLLAVFLLITRRSAGAVALLALALLPFGHWTYAHWATWKEHQREAAEIAEIVTKPAAHVPATIVIESSSVTGMRGVWAIPGIQRLIFKGAYGPAMVQFDRPGDRNASPREQTVMTLPDQHLLLRVGRVSSFVQPRQIYGAAGGPLELRFVDAQRDELVAVWYRAFNPRPTVLPLLTVFGWYRGPNTATTDEIEAGIGAFLTRVLRSSS